MNQPAVTGPTVQLPDFGRRGFYGWLQTADINDPDRVTQAWFRDYGQRNDYPKQFVQWTDPQILAAYNAYQAVPIAGNGAA